MAKPTKDQSLSQVVAGALKQSFDLDKFKQSKFGKQSVKFKPQRWVPFSKALQDVLSIPGIPMGHISLLTGHSNSGKSTTILELAASAQQMNVLPVFIITEMKFDWNFARKLGVKVEEVIDKETGEVIDYSGFFLYIDRGSLNTIEDMASFILDLLAEQASGKLPYDLLFLIDSIGSIPCKMSVEANSNNPQWNAGAYSQQFGNFINQKITLSRKENQPYTNTMVCVNKVWVAPAETRFSQPKLKLKGGDTMFYDSTIVLQFGNITNSGTAKIEAVKDKKKVEFALKTKVSCNKNHVTGVTTKGTVVATSYGFLPDDPKTIDQYKKEHAHEWVDILGSTEFDVVEDKYEFDENFSQEIPLELLQED